MVHLSKALLLGFFVGILGVLIAFTPYGLYLEENVGLDILFNLRGIKKAPSDVVIVSIDKLSASKLNLPDDPEKWPRSLHARLIENLVEAGASVIAFDMIFSDARSAEEDNLFANAISSAHNVVLCEIIRREIVPFKNGDESLAGRYNIEKVVAPVFYLKEASIASAPFPIPKVPVKVRQYWTFKTSAGDTPTMPVVVFQVFALNVYDDFIRLMKNINPSLVAGLPHNMDEVVDAGRVERVVSDIRDLFRSEPLIAELMLEELENSDIHDLDEKKIKLLTSLTHMYRGSNSRYLNFYGFPRTVTTIPYYQALQYKEGTASFQKQPDFNGKAVFVGLSENLRPEFKDGFYTVFSQRNGVDISGVEIAATAFANLLENMPTHPLDTGRLLLTVLLWGVLIGVISRLFSAGAALAGVTAAGGLYLLLVHYEFTLNNCWYPVFIPLFIQVPAGYLGAVIWKRIISNKTLEQFLPHEIVSKIAGGEKIEEMKAASQKVYGTCLITDIESFTELSEHMDPDDINNFKKQYFEAVFEPLKYHSLLIEKTTGDGIITAWKEEPGAVARRNACLTAINIKDIENQFNQFLNMKFITRIGLNCGYMSLGIVGADGHYELDLSGDTVNTTKRIEGLNKSFGTHILLSEEILNELDDFMTREIGTFILAGKSKPLVLHELICLAEEATEHQKNLCAAFSEALDDFKRQLWYRASGKFHDIINIFGKDGVSQRYITWCEQYWHNPPDISWEGEIRLVKTMEQWRTSV
jgi:adenylate cyclase